MYIAFRLVRKKKQDYSKLYSKDFVGATANQHTKTFKGFVKGGEEAAVNRIPTISTSPAKLHQGTALQIN